MTDQQKIAALVRSHDELRAVLRLAGQEIRKLNFGRHDTVLLRLMRKTLRDARLVKAEAAETDSEPVISEISE